MGLQEFRVKNGEVELHGLANNEDWPSHNPPIVFIPGLWSQAEQFREILLSLEPRKAFALSLRGRGRSSVPESGYGLQDHASDIQAFVE